MRTNSSPRVVMRVVVALVSVLAVSLSSSAGAATLRATVEFDARDVVVHETAEGARISVGGLSSMAAENAPAVPVSEQLFYVPSGFRVGDVRVTPSATRTLREGLQLATARPGDTEREIGALPRAAATTVSVQYPAEPGISLGGGNLGGFRLHSVALFPVRWEEAAGRVRVTERFDVELDLVPEAPDADVAVRQRPSPEADRIITAALTGRVVNPSDLPVPPAARGVRTEARGFVPEELPSIDGSAVDMVIITTDSLAADFQPLADWKTKKGVPTVVRTVEWIESNYLSGLDSVERVRSFIRDAYEKWGTYLVLIGGDHHVVTPRHAFNTFFLSGEEVPTDQYFACLDGNWNADGDHLFAEGVNGGDPGDNADFYPDVFVGRAPVENATEVATFIAKSFTYDKTPPANYVESHGGVAEVLFPLDWQFGDPPGNILTNGKEILRDTLDAYLPPTWSSSLRYQSDNDETRPIALSELAFGHHVFSVVGHGDAFKFSAGNGVNPFIQTADTDTLTNGDRLMVYMGVACNPNEIDLESQGESLMNNPTGGTVIVLASSREDFPIASSAQQAEILRMAFDHGITGFGAMSELGRVPYSGVAQVELTSERWTWLSKMLLGDPELRIWTREPGNLTVSHSASVPLGTASLTVTVTDSLAAPLADALVCVSDGNGTYSRARTDGVGMAVLPLTSTGLGLADVVVSLPDYRPYEGTLNLTMPAGPHLATTGQTVDDDGAGASSGNGDGVLDAGESVEYAVTAYNGGFMTASTAALSASVEAGTSATFDLLYGGVADPARVFVGPDRVNPATVPFTLDFASPSIDYIGRPAYAFVPDSLLAGGPAADEGIFVWQDRDGWHVVWGGGVDSVTVSGTVTTDGRIRRTVALDNETTDTFSLSAGADTLTFSGTTHDTDASDGLDLQLADSTTLTLTTAAAALGNIVSLGSAAGTLVFDVANGARDGQVAYLDLTFTAASGGPWTDEATVVIAGPALEAYLLTVEDGSVPPVSGNGNGVVEVGETVRLTPTVINHGTGEADGVSGTASAASGITFLDASDSYGAIASLAETSGTDGYVFTVDDGTGTALDLTLTDSLGRSWMKTMDFVAPATSDSLWFTSNSTDISLSWSAPADADLAGYNVYRSATSGSGHTKQNFELLRNASLYIDEDLPFGSNFYYYVTAVDSSGNESAASTELQAWTTQVQVPGWPSITQGFIYPSILMADTDHDSRSEVFVGSHDFDLHGWNSDGDTRTGFPLSTSFEIWGSAAAADMDQDGDDEILFGSRDSRFYGVHDDGTALWNGNPVLADFPGAGEGVRSATTIADIDGDGRLEALVGTDFGTLYAFNHDGTGVTDSTGLLFTAPPGNLTASIWGTIAVADLDNNGSKEIAFASWNDSLYVIDAAGNVMPGFPRAGTDDFRGGVVAGDLDNDGTLELLAGNFDGNLYVYNHDGTDYVPGAVLFSAVQKIAGGVALANMDADPELEIFFGSLNGKLYGLNHDGTSFLAGAGGVFADLPLGAGANDGISATPIIVDVDQDGRFEVFVGHRNKNFYGLHDDGSTVLGMPIPTDDINFSTAAAGDIDGDGDIDIAFASYDANVRVLDFAGAYSQAAIEWGTYGANNGRTATYGDLGPAVDTPVIAGEDVRWTFGIEQNAPNPFVAATTIRYTLPADRIVNLGVYNVTGRLVRTLVDGPMSAGRNAVIWDGRDGHGRRLASGIYFFRLHDGERSVTRKSVLLR